MSIVGRCGTTWRMAEVNAIKVCTRTKTILPDHSIVLKVKSTTEMLGPL